MATFRNIDGEESGTVTFTIGAVELTRNSSAELQEILCVGDPEVASSLGLARVLAAAPASSAAGLVVRIASGPSSVVDLAVRAVLPSTATDNPVSLPSTQQVRANLSSTHTDNPVRAILPSTYGDHGLRILQSTAADLLVRPILPSTATDNPVSLPSTQQVRANLSSTGGDNPVVLPSTQQVRANLASTATDNPVSLPSTQVVLVKNSTIGDLLASVQQNSTVWAVQLPSSQSFQVKNSTIGDLLASVQQNSTVWQTQATLQTSSGGGVEGSTTDPAQGVLGLHVRVAPSSIQTAAASTVGATSTNTVLVSSQANPIKVHAFSVTSTVVAASTVSFRSSLAAVLWPLVLGTGSSGITGANLAVPAPGYLFRTDPNTALTFHTPSSGPEFHVVVSYST